jgi:histidinol-phosphate aminotransferase
MPFIRYDTGDIVRLGEASPSDGRVPLEQYPPTVLGIAGRKDEAIVTPDGRRLPSVNFYTVFRDQREVLRFQLVQYGLSDLVVKLALRPDTADPAGVLESLRRSLRVRVGPDVRLELETTDRFITNADGKTVPILRRSGTRSVEEHEEYLISSQLAWLPENAGMPVLKLDWNEADCTPAGPHIREALGRLLTDPRYLNWYPDADAPALHSALAQYAEVPVESLVLTHGSDGAIQAIGLSFVRPGDRVLIIHPNYDQFRSTIEQHGAVSSFFVYDGAGPFPVDALHQRVMADTPRMLYIANPNNPIGYALELPELTRIIERCAAASVLVVVDEAYFEFCGVTVAPLTQTFRNLLVLRTFSKAFGLAGLRIGYVLASPDLARVLRRVVNPKSVTMFAKAGALAALADRRAMQVYVAEVAASRERLREYLHAQGIESYPSRANFLLFKIDRPEALLEHFATAKIFLRDRSRYFPQGRHVRMTLGTMATTAKVIEVFDEFLRRRAAVPSVSSEVS